MTRSAAFWIPAPAAGRLAIMSRPRAGEWLEDEIAGWRADGITDVVCLLEKDELRELGLDGELDLCRVGGIEFTPFPIRDRGVPSSMSDTLRLARVIVDRIGRGSGVAIHCRAGIGRPSLVAACVLVLYGLDPATALERIADARGIAVPDTDEQRDWIAQFALAGRDIEGGPCIS